MASTDEQFSLSWKDFHSNMTQGFHDLLSCGDLVDVTLAAEGRLIPAHKLVLSVCSPYFREMFKINPTQHPIVFLKDVSHTTLKNLLEFMYQGEVNVKEEELPLFMSTAEQLQVKVLSHKKQEEMSISKKSGQYSQQRKFVTVKKEPISDSVAAKRLNRVTIAANKTSFLQGEPAKRKCIDPLEAGPSKSQKGELVTVSVQEEQNYSIPKLEPEFGNENIWDEENEYDTNNDDTNLGDDDSNMDTTNELSSNEEDNEIPSILTTEEINEMLISLPSKSAKNTMIRYVKAYENFMKWRISKKEESFSESVLLTYFDELSKTYKPPTLHAIYSMLKRIIKLRHNIDLKDYTRLLAFLKNISKGFESIKTKTFTSQDVENYLTKASDKNNLANKVALIIGIAGACTCKELLDITVDDIEIYDNCIIFKLKDPNSEREFVLRGDIYTNIIKKYLASRPDDVDTKRFFLNYQSGKCLRQVIGKNKISFMPRQIASYLGLPNPERYTGTCFRQTAKSGALSSLFHCARKSKVVKAQEILNT